MIDFLFIIIFLLSIIQSLFGVGLLLFGTPILLIIGYEFTEALFLLLPSSLIINAIQISKDYKNIDFVFYKNFLAISIPMVVLFLNLSLSFDLNFNLIVGVVLILIPMKDLLMNEKASKNFEILNKYKKISLLIMGALHGITNLGGSILSAIIKEKRYEKIKSRSTIAICYFTFALTQLISLSFLSNDKASNHLTTLILVLVASLSFLITEKKIFSIIEIETYNKYFSLFLFSTGLLLILK